MAEEYLCGIYHNYDCNLDLAIYRWKLSEFQDDDEPEYSNFRLPPYYESLSVGAFASIDSKIYMFGGLYRHTEISTDIFVVDTEKLHTNDVAQIVRKIPSALRDKSRFRNAVAIGDKIYIFPINFVNSATYHYPRPYHCPRPQSRFEVFNPGTETTYFLPEPNPPRAGASECFLVLKTHILLCTGSMWLSAFDTAHPEKGWRDVTCEFKQASDGLCSCDPLPFAPTTLKTECAIELGSGLFFATCIHARWNPCFVIFELGSDPFRIEKWYRVFGIPGELLMRPRFAHGGFLFFSERSAQSPDDDEKLVWGFKKFSLACHTSSGSDKEVYYLAQQVFYFQVEHPSDHDGLFLIPPFN